MIPSWVLHSVVLISVSIPSSYYLLAMYCGWEHFRKTHKAGDALVVRKPISILKPVSGLDQATYANFSSFCTLDYPEYEILFAVEDALDPVLSLIERLQREFPTIAIRLITPVPQLGANRKVNSLCALVQAANNEVLAISDSDVRVCRDYLCQVAAPLSDPEVGAVTSFFRGVSSGGLLADLEALVSSTETVPNALVARRTEGGFNFLFGWTIATTKSCLASVGGFEAIVNIHSDDFELGNRVAAHGYRIEVTNKPVEMVFPPKTIRAFLRHELRWAIGLKHVRPWGNVALVLTFGLPWTLLAALSAHNAAVALAYLANYLVLRLGLVWTLGVWGLNDTISRRRLFFVPVRDILNFGIWLTAFFTDTIHWHGFTYRVKKRLLFPFSSTPMAVDSRQSTPTTETRTGT